MAYKSAICYGVRAKTEATYAATDTTFTVSEPVQVSELPTVTINYVYDGARPASPSTAGALPNAAPSGRFAETSLMMEARGSGSAYTSSATVPPDVHALLRSCGLSGSFSGSQWQYVPVGPCDTGESVALQMYARGEIYTLIGGRSTFSLGSDGAAPAMWTFNIQALVSGSVTDSNVASITYNPTLPPKSENIQLALGAFEDAVVRSFNIEYGREINPRLNLNLPDAHSGFAGARRALVFNTTIETPALTDLDIYELYRNATAFEVSFVLGAVAGNIIEVVFPNCQITGITPGEDGSVATSDLTIKPSVDTTVSPYDIIIRFR